MGWTTEHAASVATLLDSDFTLPEVVAGLDHFASPRTPAFLAVLVSRPEAKDRLSVRRHGSATFDTISQTARLHTLRIELHSYRFESYPEVALRVERIADGPLAIVLGACPPAVWKEAFGRLVAAAAPKYYLPFLRQQELRKVFDAMQLALPSGQEIRLGRVSGLRRLSEGSSKRSYQSQVEWPDLPYGEAFARAREDATFFRKVAFKTTARGDAPTREGELAGGLTNLGEFRVSDNVRWLFESGVRSAMEIIQAQHALAHHRDRTDADGGGVRALAATFTETSITLERLPAVAARLRAMPRASVSIIHGNPYLHASIVDLADGSIFDFVLVSPSRALLLPQGRATEGAVTRLCRYVYEQIAEAEFVDASRSSMGGP